MADAEPLSADPAADREEVTKVDFHHPYTPYAIQEEFMQTVYSVLESGSSSVGILESPTGTGKSLSLICASLTWLREHKRRKFEEGVRWEGEEEDDEPEWVIEAARARRRKELLRRREEMEQRLKRAREKEARMKKKMLAGEKGDKRRRVEEGGVGAEKQDDEEQFALDDYDSDREADSNAGSAISGLPAETLALMEKLGMGYGKPKVEEEEEIEDEVKIFYCSRTHSQLTQFINELRRVHIPPALQSEPASAEPLLEEGEFKHLTLGSRKNLCINPAVNKLRSTTAINERCMELQQTSTSKEKRCCYLPNKENQPLLNDFRDRALATIRDIEELGDLGREIKICPYYASRSAIKPAEIVTLPYPMLLQKSAREALGVSVKGHVVIVDEAHNLMDAIAGIYGVTVSLIQLKRSRAQLGMYLQRFRNKLKGKNRVYVAQVVRLVDSLAGYLEGKSGMKGGGVVEASELLAGKGVDQINLYKLLRYLQESKLARKVEGYILLTETASNNGNGATKAAKGEQPSEASTPTLQHIQSLLVALTNPSKEGRLFYTKDPDSSGMLLKYMLLDPTHHFKEIVSEARAVILAGGTMSPMTDYTSHLLSYLPAEKITTLSCGHVIPKENLLAWTLSKGPSGKPFEFTFSKRAGREGEEMIDELGRAVLNICSVVPDGVVIFFPSYLYLDTVVQRWEVVLEPGKPSIWQRLGTRKTLFREAKDAKAGTEDVLTEYAKAIDGNHGGLLLSVVGGKMSEGINFSDRLGRCVIIVGLPFPNIMSEEWKAKMSYIESATIERMGTAGEGTLSSRQAEGKAAAREFYENACMRAVNQSVGRAIRHRNDFAAIVMVDVRFGRENIRKKLPGWIRGGLVEGCQERGFGELMGGLGTFFRGKRMSQ
jgi:chromosome transmission fidelity protein 1